MAQFQCKPRSNVRQLIIFPNDLMSLWSETQKFLECHVTRVTKRRISTMFRTYSKRDYLPFKHNSQYPIRSYIKTTTNLIPNWYSWLICICLLFVSFLYKSVDFPFEIRFPDCNGFYNICTVHSKVVVSEVAEYSRQRTDSNSNFKFYCWFNGF